MDEIITGKQKIMYKAGKAILSASPTVVKQNNCLFVWGKPKLPASLLNEKKA